MAEHEEDKDYLLTEDDWTKLNQHLERNKDKNPLIRWWERGRDRLVRNKIEILYKSVLALSWMALGFGTGDAWLADLALNRAAESSVLNKPSVYEQVKDASSYRDIMEDTYQDEIDRAIREVFVKHMKDRIKAGDGAWDDRQNRDWEFIVGAGVGFGVSGLLHHYKKRRSEQAETKS